MSQVKLLAPCLSIILFSSSGILGTFNCNRTLAQTNSVQPLAIPLQDPLLPPSNVERKLSPLEIKRVKSEIAILEKKAQEKLEQGDTQEAFKLWFRQLRLYRAIGELEEIITLGRVGARAWQANLTEELKVINQRLNDLAQKINQPQQGSEKLLIALGNSYQQIRSLDQAIAVYNNLLIRARQVDNFQLEEKYLAILGDLYLNKFDYLQAAIVYKELLDLANNSSDKKNLDSYLAQLIKIYNYTKQPQQAIIVKKQLIDYYLSQNNQEQIGKLKVLLGDDYQVTGEMNLAIKSYQEASIVSQSFQQLALAAEALNKLGIIYQKQKEYPLAIQTYQKLLKLETSANNVYGVMASYEKLGKIHFILEDYDQAFTDFNQALHIAQNLNYQVGYYTDLLNQVTEKKQ